MVDHEKTAPLGICCRREWNENRRENKYSHSYSYSELDASPRRTGAKSSAEQEEEKSNHEPHRSANMESRKVHGIEIDSNLMLMSN